MTTTTTRPTFSTITVSYNLSTLAAEQLGDDALSVYDALGVYETALTAALGAEYPGAEVDVDVRMANVDASTFKATCETTEGVEAVVRLGTVGSVTCAADPDELDFDAQRAIEEDFAHADEKAWERACAAA